MPLIVLIGAVTGAVVGGRYVDGRADLYCLGASLFEALTGKLPFRATSPLGLIELHRSAPIPDPRQLAADRSHERPH